MKNNKMSSYEKKQGFTLVELLASVIVLVAIGSIIAGIVTSSLRGTNKTSTIENIRQNGNYTLNQMSKDIEYAQPFDGKTTGLSRDNGATYETSCPFSLSPVPVPVTTAYDQITLHSAASNVITKYRCTSSVLSAEGISPISPETSLVDFSASLESCSLTCVQTRATDVPLIRISFTLNSSSPGVVEKSGSITFETSVALRNYRK